MAKLNIGFIIVFQVVVITFLTAANGWAVASYAKKYGMGCKSCHTFGSALNDLGLTFKKNGHTFGEKNTEQKEKTKPGASKDDKSTVSGSSGKGSDKPGSINSGIADDSAADTALPEPEQPLPETRIYSWKSEDGTPHFSDTPYVNPPGEKKPASNKPRKKITQARFRTPSAIIPKRTQRAAAKSATPQLVRSVLHKKDASGLFESASEIKKPEELPSSYEKCMEQILIKLPPPKTSEAAMEQFSEAENICAPYKK